MCYSVKTSIFSYLMGILACIFAIYTRQYMLGMLILGYCQIQLGEAIIWRGIDTDNKNLNKIGTAYLKYTLPSHLIFIGIGVVIMGYIKNKKIDTIPLIVGILFYIGVMIFYMGKSSIKKHIDPNEKDISFPSQRSCMKRECQNNENRLKWPFVDSYYAIQTLIIFILFWIYLPKKNTIFIMTFFIFTYVITKIMYKWSASTIWCFLSAILAPILVYVNYKL